jgi:hypothetical protein
MKVISVEVYDDEMPKGEIEYEVVYEIDGFKSQFYKYITAKDEMQAYIEGLKVAESHEKYEKGQAELMAIKDANEEDEAWDEIKKYIKIY